MGSDIIINHLLNVLKMTNQVNQVFKFWIENKVSQERQYSVSDIRQQFQKWLLGKGKSWVEHYDKEIAVSTFIMDKNGLNASYENSQLSGLVRLLTPDIKNILNDINPVTKTKLEY